MMTDPTLLQVFDYAGTATFAATGAIAAARNRHDILTFIFFAAVTGIGGGTLRDVLMGVPVFWLREPAPLYIAACVGGLIWLIGAGPRWSAQALLWLDAIGLCAYAALGAEKALAHNLSGATAIVMGVMTGTFGGILRDMLASEPSVLLRREIYVTAALASAATFVALHRSGLAPDSLALAAAVLVGVVLRAGAILRGWSLPGFHGRA